jgi:hypothetical protein
VGDAVRDQFAHREACAETDITRRSSCDPIDGGARPRRRAQICTQLELHALLLVIQCHL